MILLKIPLDKPVSIFNAGFFKIKITDEEPSNSQMITGTLTGNCISFLI